MSPVKVRATGQTGSKQFTGDWKPLGMSYETGNDNNGKTTRKVRAPSGAQWKRGGWG